jgi:hypothetical protein
MSQLRVSSVSNPAGTNTLNLLPDGFHNTGVLQSVQVTDSALMTFTGSYAQLGSLLINFTPKSANSKILISSNISAKNTQDLNWSLYTLRLRVGTDYPYYRYVGTHFHNAYAPVEVSFQYDSWGTSARAISIEASAHASYPHQFNSKVWDPGAGAANNTSVLRVTEFQTL